MAIVEKEKSLLDVTASRPHAEIMGVLMHATESELNAFLKFDPEKYSTEAPGVIGFDLDRVMNNRDVVVDAQIMEVDRKGRYIMRRYTKESLFNRIKTAKIIEAVPVRPVTLMEAFVRAGGRLKENLSWDADSDTSNAFSDFTPLFMGPFYRQQYMYRMLEAKSKAFAAYTSNPVAKRVVSINTQFVLGKGVAATFKDPKAQELWDKFAAHNKIGTARGGITRAGTRLRTWNDMLCTDGELFFDFKDEQEMLRVNTLDSATILEVVTDPADINKVFYYHQQYATPYNQYSTPGVPSTRYIIRQLPAKDVLHVKINVFENEKRGRSDLYTILGWLKRLKDLINANVIKAYFHACYTWDYAIKGNATDVSNFAQKNQSKVPVPGSAYIHNEGVTRTLISPAGVAGVGVDQDLMGLLNMIALGSGIPLAYLAASFAGSRAGALTETEPSAKMFYDRQSQWDEILHEFADRLFDWAERRGINIEDRTVEFSFPQINPMDKVALANLLTTLKTNQWFKDERCASLIAKELSVTSYDYKEELIEILNEKKEAIDREFEENKYRSLAETKLQVWQTYFANLGAKEEQSQAGGSAPAGDPAAAPAGGGRAAAPKPAAGKGGETSGGMSEEQRNSVARGGR
jgi:hypothetical protein